jgi:RND family efflux transporter MFP subunit
MWRRIGCIVLIVVVGGIVVLAVIKARSGKGGFSFKVGTDKKKDEKKEPNFEAVRKGDLNITVDATGVTQPITDVEVKSEATGRITEFYVEEGDKVKKGDLICKLDQRNQQLLMKQQEIALKSAKVALDQAQHPDAVTNRSALENGVATAEATLKNAQDSLDKSRAALQRVQTLHDKGYSTDAELDQANTAVVSAESGVTSAKSNLEAAQTRLKQFSKSSNKNAIESARLNYEQAKVALEQAQKQIGDSVIVSPIDGIILEKDLDVGDSVVSINSAFGASQPIVKVADLGRIKIRTYVDEVDIGKIILGQSAEVTVDAFPGKTFSGKVVNIFPQGQTQATTGGLVNFVVIVQVENPDGLILGNMTSSVKIEAKTIKDALLIPLGATRAGDKPDTTVVEVLKAGQDATDPKAETEKREVKLGDTNFTDTIVLEGLKEGEMIKVRGFEAKIGFTAD